MTGWVSRMIEVMIAGRRGNEIEIAGSRLTVT